jgi:hypothetical protein
MSILSSILGPATELVGKFVQDKDKAAQLSHELSTMADKHAQQALLAQIEVNKAEAASGSVFKGGWRPAVGWVCGLALFWTYILQPFLVFVLVVAGVDLPPLPDLQTDELMPILLGMLGLVGARSFDKLKGVASR